MDAIKALIDTGLFSMLDMLLLGIIGVLVYFVFIKNSKAQSDINQTVAGMKALLEEERHQTQALSKTVYEIRKQMDTEKEKNFALREEIIILKQENARLQSLVTQMEQLVKQYQEEIKLLKQERGF